MSFKLGESGPGFLARMLTGSGERINYMFVEFGPDAGSLVERNMKYFDTLANTRWCGYAAVPVDAAYVTPDNVAHFIGTVTGSDIVGKLPAKGSRIKSITLAFVTDASRLEDAVMVGTSQIDNDVSLIKDGYVSVSAGISMG